MKKLTICWQRLVSETGRTCPRCSETENTIESAFEKLKKSLSALNIEVVLIKESLDIESFKKDPLQSNRILIEDNPLEMWIGASVGKSKCCEVCGNSECRTISNDKNTFEIIPEDLIVKACLLAAADLFMS